MKYRKHHNNKGMQQCKSGKCERDLKRIAKKLKIKYLDESASADGPSQITESGEL